MRREVWAISDGGRRSLKNMGGGGLEANTYLLTTLGTGEYAVTRWRMGTGQGTYATRYAPIATASLLPDVAGVIVLLTDEARAKHWEAFQDEIQRLNIHVRAERIPAGRSEAEIWEVFSAAHHTLDGVHNVVLDVTHALRSLPLVLLGSLTYLAALGAVQIRGVYYGAWEARTEENAPLFDLSPLLAIVQWSFGARALQETGNARWLGQLVRETKASLFRIGVPEAALGRLGEALKGLGWAVPAGLPLESGVDARAALDAIDSVGTDRPELALLRPLVGKLRQDLEKIAMVSRVGAKPAIALDADELARQLRMVRLYHQWGMDDRALLLLREWIISRGLLAAGRREQWLDYNGQRRPMERAMNALVERRRFRGAEQTSDQSPLPSLWDRSAKLRNQLAHAGMLPERVGPVRDKVGNLLSECEALAASDAAWSTARPGATGRLLVTPLGLAPGVLFTALIRRAPDAALIITSQEAKQKVRDACKQAGWAGACHVFKVTDAQACFGEAASVIGWARPHLLAAQEVDVNITGGTTAMQYLAERLAGDATRLGVPCQRIALIDRREPEEQRREPYIAGDVVPLSGDELSEAAGDG